MINIYNIKIIFLLFVFYSVVGWTIEVLDQFYRQKKFVNRGFLLGPYCPVHGIGALLMVLLLSGITDSYIVLFFSASFICTILEYITSFLLEKIFKARWWDYSCYKFNLNGRVCLQNSIFFGVAGVFIVKIANPFIVQFIIKNITNLNIVCLILGIIFTLDLVVSFNVIVKFKNITNSLTKDCTEEISSRVKKTLASKSILFKRLINAFPNLKNGAKKIKDNIINIFNITK